MRLKKIRNDPPPIYSRFILFPGIPFPNVSSPYYIIERAKGEGASFLKMCCRHYAAEFVTTLLGGGISGSFALLLIKKHIYTPGNMKRSGYDESNSPQWRYLLSRESERKRHNNNNRRVSSPHNSNALEEAENLFRPAEGGDIKRNRKNKKERQERNANKKNPHNPIHQKFTKSGKEILYSASPGRPLSLPQKKKKN